MTDSLRMDKYAQASWRLHVNTERQQAILAAIPEGMWLGVTHGGRQYTATLWRERANQWAGTDSRIVDKETAPRMEWACELLLDRQRAAEVTTDDTGHVTSIEEA